MLVINILIKKYFGNFILFWFPNLGNFWKLQPKLTYKFTFKQKKSVATRNGFL